MEEFQNKKKLKITKDKQKTKITFCGVKFENAEKWNVLRNEDESIVLTRPNEESSMTINSIDIVELYKDSRKTDY